MEVIEKKAETPPFRLLPLYTWWFFPGKTLPYLIAEKWGITLPDETAQLSILEIGSSNPLRMPVNEFWALFDQKAIFPLIGEEVAPKTKCEPNREMNPVPTFSHVPLHTWWIHERQTLPIVIVEKTGYLGPYSKRMIGYLRIGSSTVIRMTEADFWSKYEKNEIRAFTLNEKLIINHITNNSND
nr:hypothetical protein [uncultured Arsenicibacter sp.]